MQYPRSVRRGPERHVSLVRASGRVGLAVLCALELWAAPASAAPAQAVRPAWPRVELELGGRLLGIPSGRWRIEQRSLSAGLTVRPVGWIAVQTALEASSTELAARRLPADPFQVRTRLDSTRSWGLSHSVALRTHRFGPGRLEAFGEVRWMPGYGAMRVLELILDPGRLNLSDFGRLDQLARARFAWWQAAVGARLGCQLGPLDLWLDGGAMWARIALRWALSERALALGRIASPDATIDQDGSFVIDKEKPFTRLGMSLALPGPFEVRGTGIVVPTGHGVAHGFTLGAVWIP